MQHLTACCELYAALNYLLCYSGPLQQFPMTDVCSEYALDLSNNGPVQSSTLIKNDGTLPLTSNAAETVAVIGPNSNLSKSDVSYYGPRTPCGANYWTMIDAVTEHSSQKVITALGVPSVSSSDTSGIAAAVEMAKTADVVILAVGTNLTWAHEEQSRRFEHLFHTSASRVDCECLSCGQENHLGHLHSNSSRSDGTDGQSQYQCHHARRAAFCDYCRSRRTHFRKAVASGKTGPDNLSIVVRRSSLHFRFQHETRTFDVPSTRLCSTIHGMHDGNQPRAYSPVLYWQGCGPLRIR